MTLAVLPIKISYGESDEANKTISPTSQISSEPQESILICKNKASGKYFIYLEELKDHNILLINPDGGQLDLSADLFEEPKLESVDYLLSYRLITEPQVKRYKRYISAEPEDVDTPADRYQGRTKAGRTRPPIPTTTGAKNPSPSAYEWSRGVTELSNLAGRVTWRAICDRLGIYVGGNSARRALRDWTRENRRGWPPIPEP